jgi:hypothetical protein
MQNVTQQAVISSHCVRYPGVDGGGFILKFLHMDTNLVTISAFTNAAKMGYIIPADRWVVVNIEILIPSLC